MPTSAVNGPGLSSAARTHSTRIVSSWSSPFFSAISCAYFTCSCRMTSSAGVRSLMLRAPHCTISSFSAAGLSGGAASAPAISRLRALASSDMLEALWRTLPREATCASPQNEGASKVELPARPSESISAGSSRLDRAYDSVRRSAASYSCCYSSRVRPHSPRAREGQGTRAPQGRRGSSQGSNAHRACCTPLTHEYCRQPAVGAFAARRTLGAMQSIRSQ